MSKEALWCQCCHWQVEGDDLYILVLTQPLRTEQKIQVSTSTQSLNLEWNYTSSNRGKMAIDRSLIDTHSCSTHAQSTSEFQIVEARCPRAAINVYIITMN